MQSLRFIDVDDLMILELFRTTTDSQAKIARRMGMTSVAITHRKHKLDMVFGPVFARSDSGRAILTKVGEQVADAAISAMNDLREMYSEVHRVA